MKKKLAFVCTGIDDGLNYLSQNAFKVEKTLEAYDWEVRWIRLSSLNHLIATLEEYKHDSIEEFMFYYSGHGMIPQRRIDEFELKLDHRDNVAVDKILDEIFQVINPKKRALILDACYSGRINGNTKLGKNINVLTSSSKDEQSYEEENLQNSIFTYYFCEALEKLNQNKITLENISQYIDSKSKRQHPLYIAIGHDPIIIADKTHQNTLDAIDTQLQPHLNTIHQKNITTEQLIDLAQMYIDDELIGDILRGKGTLEKIVSMLSENYSNTFQSMIEHIKQNKPIVKAQKTEDSKVVFLVRSLKTDKNKCEVTIMTSTDSSHVTYDLVNQKEDLSSKLLDYAKKHSVLSVDLIIDKDLMHLDINHFANLAKYVDVHIGLLQRYDYGAKDDKDLELLKRFWKSVESYFGCITADALFPIGSCKAIDNVHGGLSFGGLKIGCPLMQSDFESLFELFNTTMIMLWTTQKNTKAFKKYENIPLGELEAKFLTSTNRMNTPLNLMWDDPNRYYYPEKISV